MPIDSHLEEGAGIDPVTNKEADALLVLVHPSWGIYVGDGYWTANLPAGGQPGGVVPAARRAAWGTPEPTAAFVEVSAEDARPGSLPGFWWVPLAAAQAAAQALAAETPLTPEKED